MAIGALIGAPLSTVSEAVQSHEQAMRTSLGALTRRSYAGVGSYAGDPPRRLDSVGRLQSTDAAAVSLDGSGGESGPTACRLPFDLGYRGEPRPHDCRLASGPLGRESLQR